MKKFLSFLTVMVLAVSMMVPFSITASAETSGTTGDCTWSLDGTVLTISGEGAMPNYDSALIGPWGNTVTEVILQEGVTSIGNYAFFRCKSLTSVSVPSTITYIGKYAFYECAKLTSFYIPEGVTYIGLDAFEDCQRIKEFTVPHTVTYIGSEAFRTNWLYDTKCATLYVHEDSAAHLYALNHDSSYVLTKHTYEAHRCTVCNHIEAGFEVFSGTTGSCTWSLDNETLILTISGTGAMEDYHAQITPPWGRNIKSVVIEEGVTHIGAFAFNNCTALTSVTMGETLTSIGEQAFGKCAALSELTFGKSLRTIGKYAFSNCSALSTVTFNEAITTIYDNAFSSCSNLKGVYITDLTAWCKISFNSLYANPLYYAEHLYLNGELTTELIIPEEITEIKDYAFAGCTSLHDLVFPASVTAIGQSAFRDCTELRNIKFVAGLTFIGDSAFRNNNMNFLTLPNGLTHIGKQAFAVNESLVLISIPASVNHIGDLAFETDWLNRDDAKLTVHEDTAGHAYALQNNNKIYSLIAHTPIGADIIVRATCTKEGSRTNHCSVCDQDYTRTIPMLAHTPIFDEESNLLCSACGDTEIADGRYTINKVSYLIQDGKLADGIVADWGNTKGFFIVAGRPAATGIYTYGGEKLYITASHTLANGVTPVNDEAIAEALGIQASKAYLFEDGKLVDGRKALWSDGKEYHMVMGRPALGGAFEIENKLVYVLSDGTFANGVWSVNDEEACKKLEITAGRSYLFENGEIVHGKQAEWTNGVSYYMVHGRPLNRGVTYVDSQPVYVIGYQTANGVWKISGEEGEALAAALGITNDMAYLFDDGKLVDGKNALWANGKEYYIVKGRPGTAPN